MSTESHLSQQPNFWWHEAVALPSDALKYLRISVFTYLFHMHSFKRTNYIDMYVILLKKINNGNFIGTG